MSAIDLIGNTPLYKLQKASELTGCTILGKCEFMNPGGSVKDRPALGIIETAEKQGLLEPGGLIVEGTAGNTGIGLAVVANAKGYRTLIVMPDNQAEEKYATLATLGAGLKKVPPAPYKSDGNFQKVAGRLAQEMKDREPHGVIWANQFDNTANRDSHMRTTAQEIWAQTDGKVDGFICAAGTGGTLAGVGMGLKEKNKDIKIGCADPGGANMYSWFTKGELNSEGGSIAEGIGQSRITANLDGAPVDTAYRILDPEALEIVYSLVRDEGLCMGVSTGINVAGAIRLAKEMGPGHTIVTILCDLGWRYQSRLWNPVWLEEKGLPKPEWL